MNRFSLLCATAALVVPVAAYAQETTSTIQGTVTSAGAPVPGATVTITHVPSGTRSVVTTDENGAFGATGLRVGGPYTVTVVSAGQAEAQVTDIQTVVGQPFQLPIEIAGAGEEIIVTASRIAGARTTSQGPITVLTAEQIRNVASTNRDIRDLARRDPFARLDDTPGGGRAVSFAGQNARFNRFSVDGVPITDNFGLNPDGLPSRRSPIPLDAIGQFQTKVAPYDIREGNFQGGAINIVLRSGTNEFQGTGFYSYTSDELSGDQSGDLSVTLPNFKSEDYGVQLSGPIIPDRLFFMIAGERIRAGTPIPEGPMDNNAGTAIPTLSQAQVDRISQISRDRYGYDPGGVLNNSADEDDRLVAKLDANLTDTQRASLTYSYTKDAIRFNQNTFVTPPPGLGLESNGYVSSNRLHTGVFQLNSDWTDEVSSEFRAFYKDYKRGQDPILGRGFAQFRVCTAPTSDRATAAVPTSTTESTSCSNGFSQVSLGPDVSRQSNALTSQTYGGSAVGRLRTGAHDFRVLAEFQDTKIFNLFLQRSSGDYYFDSIADFAAGNAQRLQYQNAIPSLDPNEAAARFRYQAYTFGIQDNWSVSDILNLAIGVRYDTFGGSSRAAVNPNFLARYGFANNAYISGRGVLQPRIGFDFEPIDRLTIRGGVGIFSGGAPDVYISNSFSNTGILSNSIDIRQANNGSYTGTGLPPGVGAVALTNVNGTVIPGAVNNYLLAGTVAAASPTNALDPDFDLPSQWRATLSATYDADLGPLGDGWEFGGDLFYSAVRDQVLFTDIRSVPTGTLTPDGRPRYRGLISNADSQSDILLTNTDKGRSYVAVARVRKDWDFGLGVGASYTWQDIKDQAPATSSTASSNYANGAFFDPNIVQYSTSNDEVKHNIKFDFTFSRAFFGDYKSTFALFGESRSGHPFSYTFFDPASGRSAVFGTIGSGSRYLLYVPTVGGDPLVSYNSTATQTAFENVINATKLKNYQGGVAPRNAFRSKWFTRLDLHLEQELPTFVGNSRISLFADIDNFTNLIDKDWGQIREFAFPYNVAPVRVQCLTAPVATGVTPTAAQIATSTSQPCVQYRYSPNQTSGGQFVNPADTIYSRQSLYAIRVGVRFSF
ncbi:MAG TPA: TonB-dependent receptor [Allosphingosinicella sp.]